MKTSLTAFALAAALLPAGAWACPPPLPGSVPPTERQMLDRSLSGTTEVVYGIITKSGAAGEPSLFKVLHVYRGTARKGDVIAAPVGWGHPQPFCAGMMGAAPPKPVGAYGVVAFARSSPQLDFIKPDDVQTLIREGWIRSARAP